MCAMRPQTNSPLALPPGEMPPSAFDGASYDRLAARTPVFADRFLHQGGLLSYASSDPDRFQEMGPKVRLADDFDRENALEMEFVDGRYVPKQETGLVKQEQSQRLRQQARRDRDSLALTAGSDSQLALPEGSSAYEEADGSKTDQERNEERKNASALQTQQTADQPAASGEQGPQSVQLRIMDIDGTQYKAFVVKDAQGNEKQILMGEVKSPEDAQNWTAAGADLDVNNPEHAKALRERGANFGVGENEQGGEYKKLSLSDKDGKQHDFDMGAFDGDEQKQEWLNNNDPNQDQDQQNKNRKKQEEENTLKSNAKGPSIGQQAAQMDKDQALGFLIAAVMAAGPANVVKTAKMFAAHGIASGLNHMLTRGRDQTDPNEALRPDQQATPQNNPANPHLQGPTAPQPGGFRGGR